MRYKDNLKANLISAGIDASSWESAASSRTSSEALRRRELIRPFRNVNGARMLPSLWPPSQVSTSAQSVGAGVQQILAWHPT